MLVFLFIHWILKRSPVGFLLFSICTSTSSPLLFDLLLGLGKCLRPDPPRPGALVLDIPNVYQIFDDFVLHPDIRRGRLEKPQR